ncbi:MAG TPA: DUF4199 domain-containing protein [Opitutaceae bacterium]|jgi:hypothetical protein
MKTPALFGFISALAGAVLTLVLYFAGFHSEAAKMAVAQSISTWVGLLIFTVCQVLAVRGRRTEVPASQPFGYGSALWAATQMAFVAAILSSAFSFCYMKFINPGFADIALQAQMDKAQAKGISGPTLDRMESVTRTFLQPGIAATVNLFVLFIIGVVIGLIVAGFVRRTEANTPPPIQA